jgi:peptidoglycan/LPS O-acetylase OafA/YrhL
MSWLPLRQVRGRCDGSDITRRRFITLDAMRGVAAISVMLFHYLLGTPYHIFGHAYYAVDFFFVLSGVVLTHAYGTRILNQMSFLTYIKTRLIRLYPFYALGTFFGIVLCGVYVIDSMIDAFGYKEYFLSIICGGLFVPYLNDFAIPFTSHMTVSGLLFPLNPPAWSLFFEMLAGIALFPVIKRRINVKYIVGLSLIVLVSTLVYYRRVNLGWGMDTMFGGFARTAFAFFLGTWTYSRFTTLKNRWLVADPRAIIIITVIMFILPMPRVLAAVACAILIPLLIVAGLFADTETERHGFFIWLGKISYGIYAIHFPIYRIIIVVLSNAPLARPILDAPLLLACVVGILVIALANLLTIFIDEPLRRWLNSIASKASSRSV